MAKKTLLIVDQSEIGIVAHNGQEYISLTDIAKKFGEPRIVVQNWMRARNTVHFLGVWETIHNPDFNRIEFDAFINESGTNAFTMSPSKWIEGTNAKGIISKAGKTGGAKHEGVVYASEADVLNLSLFGVTAKQWRESNPGLKGNIRDYATAEQLLVLVNLENLNAHFIKERLEQDERLDKLNEIAIYQMQLLSESKVFQGFNQLLTTTEK